MKKTFLGLFMLTLLLPSSVGAFYNNDSFWNSYQAQPVWFNQDNNGGFYGELADGMTFTQKPIANVYSLRIHKFSVGDNYFYISDKGVIRASGDLAAISIYLSLG
jgi:hypothetical protein